MNFNSEIIDEAYKLACSIERLYHKLYALEINDKKNSKEYQKILNYLEIALNYLEIALEVEREFYDHHFNSFEESNYYYTKVVEESGKMENDIDSIVNMHYDKAVARRILDQIRNKMVKSYDNIPRKKLKNKMKKDAVLSSSVLLVNYIRSFILCSSDTTKTFLSFLQIFISKTKDKYYKDALIRTKYYVSFLYRDIEDDFMQNNFNISDKVIHNSDFFACLNAIPRDDYYDAKDEYIFKESYRQMFKLNSIKDLDYKTNKNGLVAILRLCFLKSFLLQMRVEDLLDTERDFRKIIDNETNMKAYKKNEISKQLLKQMFDDLEKDEEERIIKVKY